VCLSIQLFYAFSDLKLEGVNGDSKGDERKKEKIKNLRSPACLLRNIGGYISLKTYIKV